MHLYVGTSGYSYKEWKGSFYPEKLPAKQMLNFYAERFEAVEINSTFRRLPEKGVVGSWTKQTPEAFRFVLKAPQSITHFKRLLNVKDDAKALFNAAAELKQRRGPVFFQLPPNFKKDLPRLKAFLKLLGKKSAAAAFEFRHESWFDDDVYEVLRARGTALCVADAEDLPKANLISTATFGYVRLRRKNYTRQQLAMWLSKIQAQPWDEAYVFFKHEETGTGPRFAARFLELARQ